MALLVAGLLVEVVSAFTYSTSSSTSPTSSSYAVVWYPPGLWLVFVTGLVFGLVFGLVAGFGFNAAATAWPSYVLARGWLALQHRLPWPLMRFLADAHRRGVLRQAGAVYQFRHIELQHRLANRGADEQQASSPTA